MKNIILFSLVLFSSPIISAFSQTENNFIDTKYEWFGGRLVYSVHGENLSFKKALTVSITAAGCSACSQCPASLM